MDRKTYNGFWDSFNTKLYEKVLEAKDTTLQIRINKDLKKNFVKNCKKRGGVTNVLTVFIKEVNKIEDES